MESNRAYLIAGGILLAGAGIGIIYYLSLKPESEVKSATATRDPNTGLVTVRAMVTNVGKKKGHFKIQALIASLNCPQGQIGYEKENNWAMVEACVRQGNGLWAGVPVGGWIELAPGQTVQLATPPAGPLQPGRYGLYVNAAVSTQGTTETRLKDREHYYWTTVNVQ